MFDFLGVPDPERPVPRMDPEARQRQLFAFLRQLSEARSQQEPAVMLVDDLHWIDAGSDAFVAQVVEAATGTRTLLLLNFRPEYDAAWMNRSHYQQVSLLPLGAEAISELLDDLLGRDPSLAALRGQIQDRTGGNPFFVEEMVQSLVEAKSLEGARGAYRLEEPIDELGLPTTVQTVLAARIDRLAEREKQVLQTASVIGKEVPEPVLRLVAELADPDLAAALGRLTSAEFLYEKALYPEAEYAFKHPLTQEVAYGSQLAGRRQQLHAAVARAIEELHPEKLDENAALLAHHLEEAGEPLQAARWHRRAAEWIGVSDATEAVRHWRRVRVLTATAPATSESQTFALEACFRILLVGWRVGLSEKEIGEVFTNGIELATQTEDSGAHARLLDGYATLKGLSGDFDEAIRHITRAIELAETVDDRGLQFALRQRLCWAHTYAGNHRDALQIAEDALEWSQGDLKLGTEVIGFSPYIYLRYLRGLVLQGLGRLEEAAQEADDALKLARAENDRDHLWFSALYGARLAAARGDSSAELRNAREAVEIADRLGTPLYRAMAYSELLRSLADSGEWGAAISLADQLGEVEGRLGAGIAHAATARAHLGLGDSAQARVAADQALAIAERIPSAKVLQIDVRLDYARILLATEGIDSEEAVRRELGVAMSFSEESGHALSRPEIHEVRAELARVLGNQAEYESERREAHRLYVEMGATGHAERLARELGL
jgi:adenylate cyclase